MNETGRRAGRPRRCLAAVAVIVLTVAASGARSEPAAQPPALAALSVPEYETIAAYGQLPAFDRLSVSPDGAKLAYIGAVGDELHVLVRDLADGRRLVNTTAGPGQKLRGLQWADADHLLTFVSMTTTVSLWQGEWGEYFGIFATDVTTGETWDLMKLAGGVETNGRRVSLVHGRVRSREIDGDTSLFVGGVFLAGAAYESRGQLMRVNLRRRSHTIIENRDSHERYQALLDERGEAVAVADYDSERHHWRLRTGPENRRVTALEGDALLDLPELQGLSPDGHSAWAIVPRAGGPEAVGLRVPEGGVASEAGAVGADRREHWHDTLQERLSDRVVAGVLESEAQTLYDFVDPDLARRWQAILAGPAGPAPRIQSASDGFGRVVLAVEGPTGPRFLLADLASGATRELGPRYRQLPAVAPVQAISYPAGDGLRIPAFLTRPRQAAGRPLPLVVLVHGGPESRDGGGFDWWAQALAQSGYAVLQANFRGSTVSEALVRAGDGEWGRRMQTDLSDGVQYLVAHGIVDPARVCIAGASYGGYAALAGVSLQHGIYRCAVSVAGIADLKALASKIFTISDRTNYGARYLKRWLGVERGSDPEIGARSPIEHAAAIDVPVLLIHGRNDTVVPYEQTARMAAAMTRMHRPAALVELEGEDHWLSKSATRLQMLTATVAFLKAQNPPDPPSGSTGR